MMIALTPSTASYLNVEARKPVRPQAAGLDIRAKYDAAGDSIEFANYWANTDAYDADSANSKGVRQRLVKRSRYEAANNGYADGIAQTHANFLVGLGPKLRMRTGDRSVDQLIEREFASWAKACQLRRKLWTLAHAKLVDGESFAVLSANPSLLHSVKLDIIPIECDQVTTPYVPYRRKGVIDGMTFDDYGNPLYYDILPQHPGSQWAVYYQQPNSVAARYVTHWYSMRRPQQHRGVPECKSTMQVGASSRRWREATVSAAETAARFAALIYTDMPAGDAEPIAPLTTVPTERNMIAAMPMGWKAEQMRSEHPNASYDSFNRAQISELARAKNMPYNMAACDSSQSNYASGRLDFQPYFAGVDIERADCEDCCLDKLFAQWWREAAIIYGAGDPRSLPNHSWDWPNHPVADITAEASAANTRLRSGMVTLRQVYSEAGEDYEEAVQQMADDYGVDVPRMKEILRLAIFNATNQIGSMEQAQAQRDVAETNATKQPQPAGPQTPSVPLQACDDDTGDIAAGECARWITYGGGKDDEGNRTGGRKMCLDSDGNVSKGGSKSMVGKPFAKLVQHFTKMRNNPAAHKARFEKQVTRQAKAYGMTPEQYKQLGDELWSDRLGLHRDREAAKKYARQLTGLTQADIDRMENRGQDYTSKDDKLRRFDEWASAVASQFSSLGIDPDNAESDVWDLVREGATPEPSKTSDEYHELVDSFMQSQRRSSSSRSGGASTRQASNDPDSFDYVPF